MTLFCAKNMMSVQIVISVCLLSLLIEAINAQCPAFTDKEVVYNSTTKRCYLPVKLSYSYSAARSYCHSLDVGSSFRQADLITIDSLEAKDAVSDVIVKQRDEAYDYVWLGLQAKHTDWKWAGRTDNPYLEPQGCYDDVTALSDLVTEETLTVVQHKDCMDYCRQSYNYAGVYVSRLTPKEYRCRCGNIWNNKNGRVVKDCDKNVNQMTVYRFLQSTPMDAWHTGEPDNRGNNVRCLGLSSWPQRGWDDLACGDVQKQRSHICEYDLDKSSCQGRGAHYYYHDDTNRCVQLVEKTNVARNWFEARAFCKAEGGDLLSDDDLRLHEFLKTTTELKDENPSSEWWIGGHSVEWMWPSGQPLSMYQLWDRNKPETSTNLCARIHGLSGNGGYNWEDVKCDGLNNFICETDYELCCTTPTTTTSTLAPTTTSTTTTTTTTTPAPTPAPTQAPTPAPTKPSSTDAPATPKPEATPKPSSETPNNPEVPKGSSTAAEVPDTTTLKDGETGSSTGEDKDPIFTNGVIVAVVIASVAVLVATIRLFVYCCQRRSNPSEDRKGLSP